MRRSVFGFWAVLALLVGQSRATVIHVPGDYPTIQQGIDAAVSGDIVLVASGHYLERIALKAGVTVQGAGEELSVIDGGGSSGDVVSAIGNAIQNDTKLKGFTVTGAINGGGMPGGSGVFCNSGAAPEIANNRFEGNDFGVVTWNGSNPSVHNNVVEHNTFEGIDISSDPTVINNTIAFNATGIDDGGGYGPVVMDNIVTNNSRYGVYAVGLQPQLTYNDAWGNDTNYRNCTPGIGSDSADPAFVDTATRDFHLQPGSPCINAGNPAAQYNDPDGTRNDMGAYGGPGAPALLPQATLLVPQMNELRAGPATSVLAGFNVAMNGSTITSQAFFVSGSLSGLHRAQVSYDTGARLATLIPDRSFITGEEVTAELTHSIVSALGDSLPGFTWQFHVATSGGSGRFSTQETLVTNDSVDRVISADFNLDGNLDLAVIGYYTRDVSIRLGNGDGTFRDTLHNPLSGPPNAFAVGDFNSDSIPDLAGTLDNDSIVVLLGLGNGHFQTPVAYPCSGRPQEIACADLNLDGKPDLAVGCTFSDQVAVLFGHGDGTFGTPNGIPTGGSPEQLCAADVNRDGIPDLVNANMFSDDISVFLGNGDGTFDSLGQYPTGYEPFGIRFGDFNHDGILDAAVTNLAGNSVTVLTGTGTGAFTGSGNYPVSGGPLELCVADLNADGALDIAVASRDSAHLAVLLGNGDGTFQNPVYWPTPSPSFSLASADFDNDGDLDIATGSRFATLLGILLNDNQLRVQTTVPARYAVSAPDTTTVRAVFDQLLNPTTLDSTSFGVYGAQTGLHKGAVLWDSATRTASLDPRQPLATGELVTAELTKYIAARNGVQFSGYAWQFATGIPSPSGGAFAPAQNYPTAGNPRGMTAADFNQDGSIDLVTTGNSPASIAFLKNNGNGTFAAPVYTNVNSDPIAVLAADLDMDGDIDLAVYHNEPGTSHLEILKNNGSGVFTVTATYAPAILGQDIAGADLDLDGDIDLILTDGWGSQDNVHVMLNNGDGTFTGPTTYSAGTFARGVIAQDVNNDGWPDIVVANNGNDNVTVLLNDGTGHFPTLANYATGAGPNGLFGFDLNHDGWLDLVTTHPGDTVVNVLLNNGAGGFAAPVPYPVGIGQYYVTGGDFDGDGDIDLACSGYGADSCIVLLNNGAGIFDRTARYAVGGTPWGICCADFNHDGALDLATANYGTNNVSVLNATGLGVNQPLTPDPRPLFAAFPNPFRNKLVILVPQSLTPDPRPLVSIYDVSGRLVRALAGPQSALPAPQSQLIWDCRDNLGRQVSPGIYFVALSGNRNSSFVSRHSLKVVLTR
jgi:parallel beta-helix repeat protein